MAECYFLDVTEYENEKAFCEAYDALSSWRRASIDKLKNKKSRLLSLGAGILADRVFRGHGLDPGNTRILLSGEGKPYAADAPGFHFSLSHSGNYAMCAVSEYRTGCDIQAVKEKSVLPYRLIFSDKESRLFEEISKEERTDFFYRVWTLKESIAKADGRGLSYPMKQITVIADDNTAAKEICADGRHYILQEISAPGGYKAAACEIW